MTALSHHSIAPTFIPDRSKARSRSDTPAWSRTPARSHASEERRSTALPDDARPGVRLTVRGRRVLAALLLAPIGTGLGIGLASMPAAFADGAVAGAANGTSGAAFTGGVDEEFEIHTVGVGESLWDIASSIAGTHDVRDVVAEIQRLNGLPNASLQPGQQLALPNR